MLINSCLRYSLFVYYADTQKRVYGFNLSPKYLLNNQLAFFYSLDYRKVNHEEGYAEVDYEVVDKLIFGNGINSKLDFQENIEKLFSEPKSCIC